MLAGRAIIFAAALASGQVDDSRLNYANQQANLHDQGATRVVFPPQVAGAKPQAPLRVSVGPQDEAQRGAQVWRSAATAVATPQPAAVYFVVPPQTEERLAAQVWRAAQASGGVDDSRLTWASQDANRHDQSATRAVWPSAVTPPAVATSQPIRMFVVNEQDTREPFSRIYVPQPAAQGRLGASFVIPPQSEPDRQPYSKAPQPAAQGKLGANLWVPQQEYRDPPSSIRAPQPARQGAVPATILIPQQSYVDLQPVLRAPTPAPQGPVPALLQVPPQADPSQRAPLYIASATATIIVPNPVARFFVVGEQESRYIPAAIWPAAIKSAPLAFNPFIAVGEQPKPLWEQGATRAIWSPTFISRPLPIPFLSAAPQSDPTQLQPSITVPLVAVPIFTGVLPFPYVWVPEQSDVIASLTAQLQPILWPAVQIGTPPDIVPPPPSLNFGGGGGGGKRKHHYRKPCKRLNDIFCDVEQIYGELRGSPHKKVAAAVVRDYAATRAAAPRPTSVDWQALEANEQAVASLVAIYREHLIDLDDEDIFLLGG